MASTAPYSHSSTPIMEAWLIKALRLAHSKKPADQERLRKFYREVCENESMVSRITLSDALREPRETTPSAEPSEKESASSATQGSAASSSANSTSNPTPVRIRPAHLITEPALASSSVEPGTTASTTTLVNPLTSSNASVTSNQYPTSSSISTSNAATASTDPNASRNSKRTRVAFFNIFDTTSPSSTVVAASKSVSAVTTGTARTGFVAGTTPTTVAPNVGSSTAHSTPTTAIGNPLSTSAIDLTVDSSTSVESVEVTGSVPIPDLTSSVTVSTGKTTGTGPVDPSQVTASSVDTNSGRVHNTSDPSDAPKADAQLLAILVELACCVCGKLTRQSQLEPDGQTMNANILVECVQCGALYHQMCHQPPVLTSAGTNHQDWRCGSCQPPPTKDVAPVVKETTAAPVVPATTDVVMSTVPSPGIVSGSTTTTDVGPTVGARKRKSGLQNALFGTAFRRL